MRTLALPECIDDEPDNAEAGDDGNDRTRLGQGASLRFAGADLAECPGEGTKRRRQNRGTDHVELTRFAVILRWEDSMHARKCRSEGFVRPGDRWRAEGSGQPSAREARASRGQGPSQCPNAAP